MKTTRVVSIVFLVALVGLISWNAGKMSVSQDHVGDVATTQSFDAGRDWEVVERDEVTEGNEEAVLWPWEEFIPCPGSEAFLAWYSPLVNIGMKRIIDDYGDQWFEWDDWFENQPYGSYLGYPLSMRSYSNTIVGETDYTCEYFWYKGSGVWQEPFECPHIMTYLNLDTTASCEAVNTSTHIGFKCGHYPEDPGHEDGE